MNAGSMDTWHEFAAAVAYTAEIECPGLTVWDALAEALHRWLDDRPAPPTGRDDLRAVVASVMDRSPEFGAPGGVPLGEVLDAAMKEWTIDARHRLNDGLPFCG